MQSQHLPEIRNGDIEPLPEGDDLFYDETGMCPQTDEVWVNTECLLTHTQNSCPATHE